MTSLNLGDNFSTANVTKMTRMFKNCGYTYPQFLNIACIFVTFVVSNKPFRLKDVIAVCPVPGELDLGPAFTKIAGTYSNVFTNTGKSGCIIHVAEAIYHIQMLHYYLFFLLIVLLHFWLMYLHFLILLSILFYILSLEMYLQIQENQDV